jgi:transposase-like protein
MKKVILFYFILLICTKSNFAQCSYNLQKSLAYTPFGNGWYALSGLSDSYNEGDIYYFGEPAGFSQSNNYASINTSLFLDFNDFRNISSISLGKIQIQDDRRVNGSIKLYVDISVTATPIWVLTDEKQIVTNLNVDEENNTWYVYLNANVVGKKARIDFNFNQTDFAYNLNYFQLGELSVHGCLACQSGPIKTGKTVTFNGCNNDSTTTTSITCSAQAACNYSARNGTEVKKLNTSTPWTLLTTPTTSICANIVGLASSTLFDWSVRANRSGTNGKYTQAQFTTAINCTAPTGLTSSNITSSSATVSWAAVSGATNYIVEYKLITATTWTILTTSTTSTSANITGLTGLRIYNWRVRATCSGSNGAYTQASFTTAFCTPTNLISSNITSSSATVSWAAVGGATNYRIEYKLNTATTWTVLTTSTTSTSANITGLASSTLYNWRIRANCSGINGNYTQAQFTTAINCAAPSGLDTISITSSSATVTWAAVSGATNYSVEYKSDTTTTWMVLTTSTTSTSANITGLTSSTLYYWRVRANCSGSNGDFTQGQFTTALHCAAPTGLTSSNITSSSATVSWAAVNGATNYSVEYKLNTATTWTVLASSTPSTSANITGLASSTLYDWRVRANCSSSNGDYTQSQFTSAIHCAAPTGLSSSNITSTSATLSWAAVSGATNYNLEYKLITASTWNVLTSPITSTSANITGLTGLRIYNWRVRANCSGSNGAYSQAFFTTAFCTPTNLISSSITSSSATVSWEAVNGATNYRVEYKPNTATTWTVLISSTTSTIENVTGLASATLYDWRVRANCSGNNGNYTQAQFTTDINCAAPIGLDSSNITSSSATVSWAAVNGATNYSVEYKLNTATTWIVLTSSTTSTIENITGLAASSYMIGE